MVFDLSRNETFKNIENWLEDLKNYGSRDMVTLLIGNKSDLIESRQVQLYEINDLILKYNLQYVEISAKSGSNVKSSFESLTRLIMIKSEEINRNNKNKKGDRSNVTTVNKSITLDRSSVMERKKNLKKSCC